MTIRGLYLCSIDFLFMHLVSTSDVAENKFIKYHMKDARVAEPVRPWVYI